jgi:LacI family transcriptional regulator
MKPGAARSFSEPPLPAIAPKPTPTDWDRSFMATIKDVAREAGVSVATVSRVFNDSELVSADTRRAVREVATRLNYWPHGVARSLITSRTNAVGVLLPDIYGEFFSEIIRGIDQAARRSGLHLLVSSSHANTEELVAAMRSMRGRIDGLIVMAPDIEQPVATEVCAGQFPVVLLDPGFEAEGCDTIAIANHDGALAMVRHLLHLGHRRIATVTGPERNIDARQRLAGYRAALREAGAEISTELEMAGDFTETSGYEAVERLLRLAPRPTAVFVGNDYMAIGVLGALSDAGLRVPEQMAVTGFDDIAMARYLNPSLTTVQVDMLQLGERAVGRLLGIQREPDGARRHEVLPTTLVVRSSCGAGALQPADARIPLRRGRPEVPLPEVS